MKCPKCKSEIDEKQTVCPVCRKVLLLECPNCHSYSETSVCSTCGYSILVKCSKCKTTNPYVSEKCRKCGFPIPTSLGYQECESDDYASIIVEFKALKKIRSALNSKDLYSKFFNRLKNILIAQVKGVDCRLIIYGDKFVINMNKELSFSTSSNKAARLAIKVLNAFTNLNLNIIQEFSTPLNVTLTIIKKNIDELQKQPQVITGVKSLNLKKTIKPHLKGMQIILDEFVRDEIYKEYSTDSLYSVEMDGKTVLFYELILEKYILPPQSNNSEDTNEIAKPQNILKIKKKQENKDIYSFKVFDINAKCKFERSSATNFIEDFSKLDLNKNGKILAIKSDLGDGIRSSEIYKAYEENGIKVIRVACTEQLQYKPWGAFLNLFKDYFNLSFHNNFIDLKGVEPTLLRKFQPLFDLIIGKTIKAMTPEDARFAYMEHWCSFLSILKDTVLVFEGFENLDDTTIQTLELYFDKFKNIKPNFLFTTSKALSVHTKIKGLLRTDLYTEISYNRSSLDSCLATIKSDASDFINSFYFEKISENFEGSYLYFQNALEYLKDVGVLLEYEGKLILNSNKSVIMPADLNGLFKARVKNLSKNQDVSFILAYASILGFRVDLKVLEALGIKDVEKNVKLLVDANIVCLENGVIYINNFNIIEPVIASSLKKEAENYLAKTIVAQIGKNLDEYILAFIMGRLETYKEEYLTLWKNAQFAINSGDYDAYLKNCLGFLSLVGLIKTNITKEEIEENKKEVFNNILVCLYSYSPAKIYFIENMLLMDAINEGDDEKIVKLSNLMLQGALISSNYTDALGLLHNILSRMPNPKLIVEGVINTKFLLLSLVNIEILYNIGNFKQCIECAEEILSVITPDMIETIKPASFSTNLFISHLLETFRLVGFAKLYLLEDNLDVFFESIKKALNVELPEKDCIYAIKDYLAGKVYNTVNIETYNAFSKVIFLILQEFSLLNEDYKRFAQNIYQAKLLAADIHQREIELFCDLLIAYSYAKMGIKEKAESIYKDVHATAEKSAIFNILVVSKYLLAMLKQNSHAEDTLLLTNDSLAMLRNYSNQAQILFTIVQNLYIEIAKEQELPMVDLEVEELKLIGLKEKLKILFEE